MGFTVENGASIVFDMPKTKFGPNTYVSTVKIASEMRHSRPEPCWYVMFQALSLL